MQTHELLILAVIQGLTEFLPVSSSGHLLAARYLFGFTTQDGVLFDAFLHLGTLAAVLVYYWRTWWGMLKSFLSPMVVDPQMRGLAVALVVATIPGALVGYVLQSHTALLISSPQRLAVELLVTAVILFLSDWLARASTKNQVSLSDALVIGIAQIAALLPGVSRSGITIAAGRARGLTREQATTFSFLMSAPIIAGASVSGLTHLLTIGSIPSTALVMGTAVSFLSGLAAIFLFMKIITRISLTPFAVYLVLLAGLLWYAQ